MKDNIKAIREAMEKIAPLPWQFAANVPFYVEVTKPRASQSKHDHKRPEYWDYNDGVYLAYCVNMMPELLDYIAELEASVAELGQYRDKTKESGQE